MPLFLKKANCFKAFPSREIFKSATGNKQYFYIFTPIAKQKLLSTAWDTSLDKTVAHPFSTNSIPVLRELGGAIA